jgi:hypothetical protein
MPFYPIETDCCSGAGGGIGAQGPKGDPGAPGAPGAGAIILFGDSNVGAAPNPLTHRYLSPGFTPTSTSGALEIFQVMPRPGTLRNMSAGHSSIAGGPGGTVSYILRHGPGPAGPLVDTLLIIPPMTTMAIGSVQDLINSIVVAQGDLVSIRLIKTAPGSGLVNAVITVELA